MGAFLWSTFFGAFADSQYGLAMVVTSFFGIALYAALLLFIIYKSFDLCHELPNSVMQWIGGSAIYSTHQLLRHKYARFVVSLA